MKIKNAGVLTQVKTKRVLLIAALLLSFVPAFSQTYYVKENQSFEQPIFNRLVELNQKVTTKQEYSDYTIECIVSTCGIGGSRAKGYIIITDTKTGSILFKSKEIKGISNAFNGYKNPCLDSMEKTAKDYLADLILQANGLKK